MRPFYWEVKVFTVSICSNRNFIFYLYAFLLPLPVGKVYTRFQTKTAQ